MYTIVDRTTKSHAFGKILMHLVSTAYDTFTHQAMNVTHICHFI